MKLDADELIKWGMMLLKAAVILVAGHYLTVLVINIMKRSFKKIEVDVSLEKFLCKTVNIVLHVIIILSALNALGISTTGLLAALSAAAVAVALALKDSLSSIAGGIILLLTKRFKTGDFIEINGEKGNVLQIDMMHTVLKTLDNRHVVIPNGVVVNSQIVDYSSEETRRLDLVFSVSYENDIKKAEDIIISVLSADGRVLEKPEPPFARVCEYAASSVDIAVQAWCKIADYLPLKFDLLEEVRKAFDENGITIPYNQLDVHITNS